MRQNRIGKSSKDRVAIALVLCFSVVALASVFTVKSSIDKINLSNDGMIAQNSKPEEQSVTKPVPTVDSMDNPSSKQGENNSSEKSAASSWALPVDGTVSVKYSTDVPIYSKTLDQYMVHNGIDISAPLDTQVKAVANGTIVNVYKDDALGTTIEINHGNGFITTYSNLSIDSMVEQGDVVKKGDIISGVGDTSLFEALDGPHLHFEMKKDGQLVNPADYLPL
ncbi:M23 family metallopeptidase [Clostridium aminobutyricum]|uniref:M23 family metallopeptidase n=1 Tax=Clostridium aminobutyricum TaxID=33953 RepID=A0A939IGP8_CLOAM|nr:M23 family metallopeptidase [Clostridium aminobutyricum]MBN7773665.1 M23 family metallopeptidase [Clostridium aminobutyricum]